jgi:hypothetical protein
VAAASANTGGANQGVTEHEDHLGAELGFRAHASPMRGGCAVRWSPLTILVILQKGHPEIGARSTIHTWLHHSALRDERIRRWDRFHDVKAIGTDCPA